MVDRTVIALHAEDWAKTRFVRSLLWEASQAVRTLLHPRQQLHHHTWLNTVDQAGARARLPVLLALNPAVGWVPDFTAPAPQTGERGIEAELAEVATYPLAAVAADLQRSLLSHPSRRRHAELTPLIDDPAAALALILAELRWAWETLLAPFWEQVSDLVAADVAHRSRAAARVGLGRVIAELHPDVTWRDATITVAHSERIHLDLGGQGLALMPSVFVWPHAVVAHDAPWPPTLIYPARGVGDLWTAPPPPSAGLAGVLGPTRARLLTDLCVPATTTTLAARHRLSPAAVSAQLSLLREAALVTARRSGKEVHYRRTPTAEALIAAAVPRSVPGDGQDPDGGS